MRFSVLVIFLLLFCRMNLISQDLVRKPYLQKLGPKSVVVKLRLKESGNVKLFLGTDFSNLNISQSVDNTSLDHDIFIENLYPNTKYYYKIKVNDNFINSDSTWNFKTAPPVGAKNKFSFWSIGDLYGGPQQLAVYEGFKKFRKNNYTNLFLTVGDNVYCGGSDECLQSNFFNVYQQGSILQQAGFYPATGNHDYDNYDRVVDNPKLAYFNSFILPSQGEIGGEPSNSEAYYSFNYANAHFVILESTAYGKDGKQLFDSDNLQLQWLKIDLAKNKQDWTIVVLHHPLFTKGSYDSDASPDLIKIRSTLAPIFDQYNVDIVLTGHSHTMERSKPTRGHYGHSSTFDEKKHQKQTSSGLYNGSGNSCPYFFNGSNLDKSGVIYVTNGSSGATSRPVGLYGKHPIMFFENKSKIGSFFAEIEDNKFVGKFIDDEGSILDQFTIFKSKDSTCVNCFTGINNFGCGPSGKPKLLSNSNFQFCKGQAVELLVEGDNSANFNWYQPNNMLFSGNRLVLNNLPIGKSAILVSQVVNGFESEKLKIPIQVNDTPIIKTLTVPNEVFPFIVQTASVVPNDSIQSYNWTLPPNWEGNSTSNTIYFKPNRTDGEITVIGTSKFGCLSNELKQKIQLISILGIDENFTNVKIFPNPLIGDYATLEVPNEYIGAIGQWVDVKGQILSSQLIQNKIQQLPIPKEISGVLFYRIISNEKEETFKLLIQ